MEFNVDDTVWFSFLDQPRSGNYRGKIDSTQCCVVVDGQNWVIKKNELFANKEDVTGKETND